MNTASANAATIMPLEGEAPPPPPIAGSGDKLSAADMTKVAKALLRQAADVTLRLQTAKDDEEAKALLEMHRQLTAAAMTINNKAVQLLAGEAKVEGGEIVKAIEQANKTLKTIKDIVTALAILQKILVLTGAVLSGNGTAILSAIGKLAKDTG